jgi:hypothetical protein
MLAGLGPQRGNVEAPPVGWAHAFLAPPWVDMVYSLCHENFKSHWGSLEKQCIVDVVALA